MNLATLIAQLMTRAAGKVVDLKATLERVKAAAPDLAPEIDPLLALLDAPVNIAGVATAIVPELGNIVLFKFDGRTHPSDGF